jgi:hypothetical protein
MANTQKEIDSFFGDRTMQSYEAFYGPSGKDWSKLDSAQFDNRWAVVQMADSIIIGAASLGETLSVDEALQRAHAVVAEPVREKIIREELKGKALKRSKGLSIPPSSGKSGSSAKPSTKEEFEIVTQQRLSKVFK